MVTYQIQNGIYCPRERISPRRPSQAIAADLSLHHVLFWKVTNAQEAHRVGSSYRVCITDSYKKLSTGSNKIRFGSRFKIKLRVSLRLSLGASLTLLNEE